MRSRGFDQLWERVRQMRNRPEFPFLQATLPPLKQSSEDPISPTLGFNDRFEYWLLTLTNEQFEHIEKPRVELKENAPSETGDPIGDKWEREFWAKQRG